MDLDMVVLMCKVLMLCHPFFNKETKKLMDKAKFYLSYSSFISAVPTPLPRHKTFFNCHLRVPLTSFTLASTCSVSYITMGNFPILLRTLPNNLGIYLIKDSEAIN